MTKLLVHRDAEGLRLLLHALTAVGSQSGAEQATSRMREVVLALMPETLAVFNAKASQETGTALLRIGGPSVGPLLMASYKTAQDAEVRLKLLEAMWALESRPEPLLELVSNSPHGVAELLRLGLQRSDGPETVALFAAALGSLDGAVRQAAMAALELKVAAQLAPALRARLRDPSAKLRLAALRWIHDLRDTSALLELERLLLRAVGEERLLVVRTLLHVAGPNSAPLFVKLLEREPDEQCLLELAKGLVQVHGRPAGLVLSSVARRGGLTPATIDGLMGEVARLAAQ